MRRPCDDDAIGRDSAVQNAVGDAVHVFDVLGETHAETIEVEMRVASNQRIVRPIDDVGPELPDGSAAAPP